MGAKNSTPSEQTSAPSAAHAPVSSAPIDQQPYYPSHGPPTVMTNASSNMPNDPVVTLIDVHKTPTRSSDTSHSFSFLGRGTSMITRYNFGPPAINTKTRDGGQSTVPSRYADNYTQDSCCTRCMGNCAEGCGRCCEGCATCVVNNPGLYACFASCFVFAIIGGGITYLVFMIMALAKTNNEHQKDICHASNMWIYMLTLLLVSSCVGNCLNMMKGKEDDENNSSTTGGQSNTQKDGKNNLCVYLIQGTVQCGFTGWGIYELWFVGCVDQLHGKLLYRMFQVSVFLSIIATGFFVLTMLLNCCLLCGVCNPCIRSAAARAGGGDNDQVVLRSAPGGNDDADAAAQQKNGKRVAWNNV